MTVYLAKGIKAKRLNIKGARAIFRKYVKRQKRKILKSFEETTRTWDEEKPTFKASEQVSSRASEVALLVGPSGDTHGANKWLWLDEGTDVRYATMTPDFVPKTRVGRLRAGRGKGGVAFINQLQPKPGIEARGWTQLIEKKHRAQFKRAMEAALREVLAATQ